MMGIKNVEAKLFYEISLDRRIPEDHLLRRIEQAVDFSFVYSLTRPYYSHTGQPSVDPVALFKMALLGYLYGLASERRLAQEVELNLAYRWFLGYDLDEATPNHSVLSNARRRFGKQVYEEFFRRVVLQCEAAGLIEGTTLYLDSTLVPASADVDSARSRTLLQQLPSGPSEFVEQLWKSNPDEAEAEPRPPGPPTGQHTVNQWISSRTDPEAGMVSRGRGYPPHFAYKDHLCVDGGRARIVTAVRVTSGQRADEYELPNLVEGSAPWISWSRISGMSHAAVPSDLGGQHGKGRYPAEFRQRVLDLVAAGRRVEDIARDLGISDQTVYSWRRQDRIDRGLEAGLTSAERAELISARGRIRELETELAIHRRAAELLKGTPGPKDSRQSRQWPPRGSR